MGVSAGVLLHLNMVGVPVNLTKMLRPRYGLVNIKQPDSSISLREILCNPAELKAQ